ncbi:MAG: PhaM family polyhydroxyalkanoate granule multifunctional regulatory protein [Limnohabitans sp.]
MSDTSAFGFGKFVPGFDFLQNLSKTAAQAAPAAGTGAVPGMASWVAPTLSVEEIDKRIQELKSVLFWLEQNTTALKATIQAMEVQKMTLSTLQSMNVSMADLAKAFTAKAPVVQAPAAVPEPAPAQAEPAPEPEEAQEKSAPKSSEKTSAKPAVDPMQWWGALTQQFQDIAAAAVKDVAAEAMKAGMTAKGASTTAASKKSSAAKKAPAKKTASAKTQAAAKSAPRKAASKRTDS